LVILDVETDTLWSFDVRDQEGLRSGLQLLAEPDVIRVAHNGIGFDDPALLKLYPDWNPQSRVRDTMILTRLMWADIKDADFKRGPTYPRKYIGSHSLAAWGHRLGVLKDEYKGGFEEWSQEMQDYCEQDVRVTAKLWKEIAKRSKEWGLDLLDFDPKPGKDCIQLEHDVAYITERQTRYGFAFDVPAAYELLDTLKERHAEINEELQKVFPPITHHTRIVPKANNKKLGYKKGVPTFKTTVVEFNPASRQQVGTRLQSIGWVPKAFTAGGQPEVSETILESIDLPEAQLLAEYFTLEKRIGQLSKGKNSWLKLEKNGRIHGRVITNGAVTGRMTHTTPNMAQVPSIENAKGPVPYGRECRALFVASPGKKLIGCDADALELRDLAGYMAHYDDGAYVETILKGKKDDGTDMHSLNAKALGCSRTVAKTWFSMGTLGRNPSTKYSVNSGELF
jgi:DNA polymerase-1